MALAIINRVSFAGVIGVNEATAIIGPHDGIMRSSSLNFFSDDVGTLKFYIFSLKSAVDAAVSASATFGLRTDAAGDVEGHTPITSDFLIIARTVGGSAFFSIDTVGAVSSGVRTITLGAGATVTAAASDRVYLCKAADVVSITTTADQRELAKQDLFVSNYAMPLYIEVSATGTNEVSGTYDVERD